jgi:mono/diheme cytochrome c family protein
MELGTMKIINVKRVTFAVAIAVILGLVLSANAQDSAALFKSKCAGCHAADGTGSPMGKKLGGHTLLDGRKKASMKTTAQPRQHPPRSSQVIKPTVNS